MTPSKIKSLLVEREISMTTIAHDLRVSQPSVSLIVSKKGRSYRIEKSIADRLGIPYSELFGDPPRRRAA